MLTPTADVDVPEQPVDADPMPSPIEEGPRMRKLREVFNAALTRCLDGCSYIKVSQGFSRLARDNPDALKSAHQQLVAFIQESMREEFNDINTDHNVVANLNELDRIIALAQERAKEQNTRGTGQGRGQKKAAATISANDESKHFSITPEKAVRAHAVNAKRKEIERLRAQLAEVESSNKEELSRLSQARIDIEDLQRSIEASMAALVPPAEIVEGFEKEVALLQIS